MSYSVTIFTNNHWSNIIKIFGNVSERFFLWSFGNLCNFYISFLARNVVWNFTKRSRNTFQVITAIFGPYVSYMKRSLVQGGTKRETKNCTSSYNYDASGTIFFIKVGKIVQILVHINIFVYKNVSMIRLLIMFSRKSPVLDDGRPLPLKLLTTFTSISPGALLIPDLWITCSVDLLENHAKRFKNTGGSVISFVPQFMRHPV